MKLLHVVNVLQVAFPHLAITKLPAVFPKLLLEGHLPLNSLFISRKIQRSYILLNHSKLFHLPHPLALVCLYQYSGNLMQPFLTGNWNNIALIANSSSDRIEYCTIKKKRQQNANTIGKEHQT